MSGRRGRSAGRSGGGMRGGGGSRSRSRSGSRGGGGYRGYSRPASSVARRGSQPRWTGYRYSRPRSYTRYYGSGRPYRWYQRNYSTGYWSPYAYRAYVNNWWPAYYRYPYYSYYAYEPSVYTVPVVTEVIVNDVKQLTEAPADPAAWARLPNRVIHDRQGREPVFLYCERGSPTVVAASASTAQRPVREVDGVYYQCSTA